MIKKNIIKDLKLIVHGKMFWLFELAFIAVACMISVMTKKQFSYMNMSLFRLSFPLAMSYAALTFIPIGDFHREQRNGCFSYLMGTSMKIQTYVYSKGIVMGIISFVPSFLFILLGIQNVEIVTELAVAILIFIFAMNISFWYAYEIIVSTNPVKTMGKANIIAIGLFIILAISSKININEFSRTIIIIAYIFNSILFYWCVIKIRTLSLDSILCRR
ncbi:MAG: hypothetical protein IKI69_06215 [Oscillospiraceae bacterium]|nr:hypothetical protein [Oscillospiraceae bacterium]